jgi:hypothetical protein
VRVTWAGQFDLALSDVSTGSWTKQFIYRYY